ncbi:hypothetical protein BKA65DRAFT_485158 [Rhexocercosporidium sp. MPI-PUGE-AT-0058]|nr:hypothetical protein BKA65DRAFT_485158 [Rhexocercosporidium sp. MPI-PUGE-AT-0058]
MSYQMNRTISRDENDPPTSQSSEQQPDTRQGGQSVGTSGNQNQGRSTGASASNTFPPGRLVPFTSGPHPSQIPMGLYMPGPNGNVVILSLSQCAAQGHLPLVQMALDGGASPHFANQRGETALHLAAQCGHVGVVELLLERGADMNARDTDQRTALYTAAENGYVDVARLLLQRAVVNSRGINDMSALHWAAQKGHERVISTLVEAGADVNWRGFNEKTALHWAAQMGHERVVNVLVEARADKEVRMREMTGIPYPGARPLHLAVLGGHIATVCALLDSGTEIDGEDRWFKITPLHAAALSGNCDIVQLLLERGAKPNRASRTSSPLVSASSCGYDKIVQLLLDKCADTKVRDGDGDPALHSAAANNHVSTVELLLKRGADANARGAGGRTARWYAAHYGQEAVVGLLPEPRVGDNLGRDMKDDSHIPFGKIADGDIFRHIEQAQQSMLHESASSSWSQNLFFVVNPDAIGPSDFDLDLIRPDTESNEPYIAVSYCWSGHHDSSTAAPLRIRIPQKDKPGSFYIREVRAQSAVIRGSVEFAAAKAVKRIWIDQECIDQDDVEVKQQAIQSMHLIYQQATHTLVLLDRHVQSLEDIQVLPEILNRDMLNLDMYDDLIDRILGDKWFTRAWTSQEWINSKLETLSYLVCWEDGLDVDGIAWRQVADARNRGSGKFQKIPRAWELSHDEIFNMSGMSIPNTEVMKSLIVGASFAGILPAKKSFTLLDPSAEEMDGKIDVALRQSKKYQKLRMTMPAAYKTLYQKRNLLVSDRLAILSNLAHYRYRIDTNKAVQKNLSFTACVMATALYNGDLTVLFCRSDPFDPDGDKVPENQRNHSWARSSENGLSTWNPRTHSSLSDRIRAGDPCLILDNKALVRGILWKIVPFYGFDELKDVVGGFLEEFPKPFRTLEGKIDEVGHMLFQLLVEILLSLDRTDILELLLVSALPRQLSGPEEAFKLIGELKQWRRTCREEDWPKHILEKSALESINKSGIRLAPGVVGAPVLIHTEDSLVPPYNKTAEFPAGHPWGNQIMQWIYRAISEGMPLALGQCDIGGETLVSLFMLDPAKHSTVFTPLSELEYEYGANAWIHMEPKDNFWVVKDRGRRLVMS